ncbi:MAG: 2-oxo acid dehydrogenase subunit E2 [Sphingomonadales bacterium]|nr:2-oxo acid dehydrogenase subunit E2 [Sphingomonadales bacterium]
MLDHMLWSQSITPDPALVEECAKQGIPEDSYVVQPLDVIRRTMARRMSESFSEVPHFSLKSRIEVDRLQQARAAINVGRADDRVSFNDLIIKAVAIAIARYPAINASYHPRGILLHAHADVAVAVAIEGGLITPIIREAEGKSVGQISSEMKDMAARARRKRLLPEEYSGGTITISNLGMFGVTEFTSIINPPQACILSVGAAFEEYRVVDGAPYVATVIAPTLTCDHRVVDGATGARWLQHLRDVIEAPEEWATA